MTPDQAIDLVARWMGLRLTIIDLRRQRPYITDRTENAALLRAAVDDLARVEAELLAAGIIRDRVKSRRKKSA